MPRKKATTTKRKTKSRKQIGLGIIVDGKLVADPNFDKSKISLARYFPIVKKFGIGNGKKKQKGQGAILDSLKDKGKILAKDFAKTQLKYALNQLSSDGNQFLKQW